MNYIKKLQKVEKNRQEIIDGIRTYLNSDKFSIDIMVNKNDILLRLNEYENNLDIEINGEK